MFQSESLLHNFIWWHPLVTSFHFCSVIGCHPSNRLSEMCFFGTSPAQLERMNVYASPPHPHQTHALVAITGGRPPGRMGWPRCGRGSGAGVMQNGAAMHPRHPPGVSAYAHTPSTAPRLAGARPQSRPPSLQPFLRLLQSWAGTRVLLAGDSLVRQLFLVVGCAAHLLGASVAQGGAGASCPFRMPTPHGIPVPAARRGRVSPC